MHGTMWWTGGDRAKMFFSDEQDYLLFSELLKETTGMWNVGIAAFGKQFEIENNRTV
jgi:hypothetical protein